MNRLKNVATDFCAGKAEDVAGATQLLDDTLRAVPGIEDIPWTRFDEPTQVKLRAYEALRARLRELAADRKKLEDEIRSFSSDDDRGESEADDACKKAIDFAARGRVANFRVVGGSGSRYQIEIGGVHAELVTTKTEWSTIGWASLPIVAATSEQIAMMAVPPIGQLYFEVSPDTIQMARQCQDAFAASAKDSAARMGTKAALDHRGQKLRHTANTLAVEMVAACRGEAQPAAAGSNDPRSGAAQPPVQEQLRDLTGLGLALSVQVPPSFAISPRSTGKGPTRHADIDPTGLNIDLIEWATACASVAIPADARPVLAEDKDGTRLQYYAHADGSHGGVLCNARVGFRCSFDGVPNGRGAEALRICRSVERVAAGVPGPSDRGTAPSLTVDAIKSVMASQVSSLSATGNDVGDTFDDGASAWLPDSLVLAEGKDKIAARTRTALGQPTRIEASAPIVGIDESIGWATSQWKVTTRTGSVIMARVTEVFVLRPAGLRVVAASFSLAPARGSAGLKLNEPAIGDDYPDWIEPEGWLGSPTELAKHLRDDPATVVIGSDANEFATGPAAVQRLVASWRKLQLAPMGGVQATEEDNYKIVTAVLRTSGANPSVYQTLAVFTASGPERAYQLATAHFSTPQEK